MDARSFYDGLGRDYDVMVSWEQRLSREQAFFRQVFAEGGVRRVLDAACGTGMHAIAFARLGCECVGADLSPVMVNEARGHARAAGVQVRFEVAAFGRLSESVGRGFQAVTCLGNSLPHLLDDEALSAALSDFAAVLASGGTLIIQNRNYDRLLRERRRFLPLSVREEPGGETLFLRITDLPAPGAVDEESISFTLVTLRRRGEAWSMTEQTTPLRALRRATLEAALAGAGFTSIRAYGSYARDPYDAPGAGDLLIVARRG